MTALPGKYAEVSVGGTLLDLTTDEIVVGADEETIEGAAHSDDITQTEVIRGNPYIEIQSFVDGDLSILKDAGIMDSSTGELTTDRAGVSVTVTVYEGEARSTATVEISASDAVPTWSDDLSIPEDDFSDTGITFNVNGSLTFDSTPADDTTV